MPDNHDPQKKKQPKTLKFVTFIGKFFIMVFRKRLTFRVKRKGKNKPKPQVAGLNDYGIVGNSASTLFILY